MGFEGAAIDQLFVDAVDAGTFHGVAALVVDREGVLYEGAFGEATLDTVFRNASMTKAVATTAALQLLQQGDYELDTPVAELLPEFGELQVLERMDGDRPVLRAPATQATMRQLMTHTAGCGYFFLNRDLFDFGVATGWPTVLDGPRKALSAPLVCDPGTVWEYGCNTDWVGLVVERLSGQTLGDYLAEHVWGPLDMRSSSFERPPEGLLDLRFRGADGTLEPTQIDLPADQEWEAGGHGSYGTIGDYGRFVRAWLGDGGGVLSPETIELALQDHIEGIPQPELLQPTVPELSNPVPRLPFPQGWGLGFHLTKVDIPNLRSAGTADWAGLFNSYYWIDRKAGVGGVLMTQILPFFDAKVVEALVGFEAAVYAQVGAATTA